MQMSESATSKNQLQFLLNIVRQEASELARNQVKPRTVGQNSLQRQTNIMFYELRILKKALELVLEDDGKTLRQAAESLVRVETLQENFKTVNEQLYVERAKVKELTGNIQEMDKELQKRENWINTLKKKTDEFDKFGGKVKIVENEKNLKACRDRLAETEHKIRGLEKKAEQAEKSLKIYIQLCQEQQSKLCEALLEAENLRKDNERLENIENDRNRENMALREKTEGKNQIELLSLRQKVREQSQTIQKIKCDFQKAKTSWQNKEHHYSKVLEKHFLKDELL